MSQRLAVWDVVLQQHLYDLSISGSVNLILDDMLLASYRAKFHYQPLCSKTLFHERCQLQDGPQVLDHALHTGGPPRFSPCECMFALEHNTGYPGGQHIEHGRVELTKLA